MPEQQPPLPEKREPADVTHGSGGVNLDAANDISIGGDVVGRDKITQTTHVTQVGMSPEAVRRLIITVGALVFATAFCFFGTGAVAGAVAISAFQREIVSTPSAAEDFQQNLQKIQAAPSGVPFEWQYTETDISSYVRLVLGPPLGMGDTGRARLLSSQQTAFRGNWPGVGNLPVMLVTTIQTNAAPVYRLDNSFVQVLPLGDNLGWVPVPNGLLQPLMDQINRDMGVGYIVRNVQYPPFNANGEPVSLDGPLTLTGVTQ